MSDRPAPAGRGRLTKKKAASWRRKQPHEASEAKGAVESGTQVEKGGLGTVEVFFSANAAAMQAMSTSSWEGTAVTTFCAQCQCHTQFYDNSCQGCGWSIAPQAPRRDSRTFDVARDLAGKSVSVDASCSALEITFRNDEVVVSISESADFVHKLASAPNNLAFATDVSSRLKQNYNDEVAELTESVKRNRAAYAAAKKHGELDEIGALALEHDELTSRLSKVKAASYGTLYQKVHVPVRLKRESYILKTANAMVRLGEFEVQWLQPHSGGTTTVEAVFAPDDQRQRQQYGQARTRPPPFKKTELPALSLSELLGLMQQGQYTRGGRSYQGHAHPVVTFKEVVEPSHPRQ